MSPRSHAEAAGFALALLLVALPAAAETWKLGGDARYYQFFQSDDPQGERRDAELAILRVKLEGRPLSEVAAEVHGIGQLTSPPSALSTSIATGTTTQFLDLSHVALDRGDLQVIIEVDRLNLAWERPDFRLAVGRQAITWGVNFFWPVLDLFAPFPPERIDREYKPGVDAVRLTLPLGGLSELEVIGAGQGSSLRQDGSVGALARFHLGAADLGVMAGWFHGDQVAGGFVTANVRDTGLRAEVAFTKSEESPDEIGHDRFWRASAGLDRQLTPSLSLTAELAWNGFGASDPRDYPVVAASDRVQRGEVTSLGKWYAGTSLAWQAHPLLSLTGTLLLNLGDGSALLLPHGDWSLSDNVAVVFGGTFGLGPGLRSNGNPGSEYGPAPQTLYAAIKAYF